jgi:hypothetical protein
VYPLWNTNPYGTPLVATVPIVPLKTTLCPNPIFAGINIDTSIRIKTQALWMDLRFINISLKQ